MKQGRQAEQWQSLRRRFQGQLAECAIELERFKIAKSVLSESGKLFESIRWIRRLQSHSQIYAKIGAIGSQLIVRGMNYSSSALLPVS